MTDNNPTTLKMETDWSNIKEWEIPFSLNGLNDTSFPCWIYYGQGLQSDCISLVIFYSQLLK